MTQVLEITAVRTGGRIPLGLLTVRQALKVPVSEEFKFRHADDKRPLTPEEIENLAKS